MTKAEVKDLCEFDPKLQWWAMVLFAEIMEFERVNCRVTPEGRDRMCRFVEDKCLEFPRLVVQEQLNRAKEHFESLKKEGE